jgi:hypothetical protein
VAHGSDALVIRGGVARDVDVVARKIQQAIDRGDGAVLSVYIDSRQEGESHDAAVARISREADIRYGSIQVSTLGRLQQAGFRVELDVLDDEPPSHHHVHFEVPVSDSQVHAFISCFDEPVPNPGRGTNDK